MTEVRERAWDVPSRSWSVAMCWHDLLFMHWPIDADVLRPHIPSALQVDTCQGQAWIGVVPFRMTGVRHRCLPPLPGTSAFPELNVRTYACAEDKPGVWFFSLDAADRLAVWLARRTFYLPYHHAEMSCTDRGGRTIYSSGRMHPTGVPAVFEASYRPVGSPYRAKPGTLDHWLTARYCLYAADRGQRVWRGEIDHTPWPLQQAEANVSVCQMTAPLGIELPPCAPLLHFARKLEVVAWSLEKVDEGGSG